MKTKKEIINEQELNVLYAKKGYFLQIKSEYSSTGKSIPMGEKVMLGTNYWVTGSPIEDSKDFYEEVEKTDTDTEGE